MTTITIGVDVHDRLRLIKIRSKAKSLDAVIRELLKYWGKRKRYDNGT